MTNRIKELRKKKNASQDDIAKALNTTRQAISQYETEMCEPTLKTWLRLADYYDVPVAYLKGYTAYTCENCGRYFITEPNASRKDIKCCPYCFSSLHFKEDNLQKLADYYAVNMPVVYVTDYTVYTCENCGRYFISESNVRRKDIDGCPYCLNCYFEDDF